MLAFLAGAPAAASAQDAAGAVASSDAYALTHARSPANSVRVLGNYYFFDPTQSTLGPTISSLLGGFRVSTGIAGFGQPLTPFDPPRDGLPNLPYVGLGYSHLWFNSQLSLNADFGLASQSGAGLGRLRGLFGIAPGLEEPAGDPRWAPVMAVNMSFSF
ncbi:MAG TPA: hypothetical protein VF457_11070 [Burkholderiaceae bacterium]